jgi:hypothetical protein
MVSSGMFRRVELVRIDVSDERRAIIIRVTRNGELRTYPLPEFLRGLRRLRDTLRLGYRAQPVNDK